MQTHIDKAYKFLDEHLPYEYVKEVKTELSKKGIDTSGTVIRNVRTGKSKRLDVLNALLIVAKQYKNEKEELVKILK